MDEAFSPVSSEASLVSRSSRPLVEQGFVSAESVGLSHPVAHLIPSVVEPLLDSRPARSVLASPVVAGPELVSAPAVCTTETVALDHTMDVTAEFDVTTELCRIEKNEPTFPHMERRVLVTSPSPAPTTPDMSPKTDHMPCSVQPKALHQVQAFSRPGSIQSLYKPQRAPSAASMNSRL
jgi:hypothetical protein